MIFDPDLDLLERMCLELKRRFPGQLDWMERTALLHEARGDLRESIADYERPTAFADSAAGRFDEGFTAECRRQIDRLRGLACRSRP